MAVLVLLCAWPGAAAEQPLPLTLQGAVALALRQNPELAAAGAELGAAAGAELAARGLDDPILSASGTGRVRRAGAGAVAAVPPAQEVSATLQLAQPLPTGGQVALGIDTGYVRARLPGADPTLPLTASQSTHSVQLTLQQPLLRGFGAAVARAEQRRSRFGRQLASAERSVALTALLRDVVSGYWRLGHARRELALRRDSATAARQQLERVIANIAVGKLPPSASAEIEVVIVLRDDAVLLAEQALTEREQALGRLCGLSAAQRLLAMDPLPAIDPAAPAQRGLAATLAAALAYSPELQVLRARGQAAAVEVEVRDDALLPRLDLALAGGPLGSAPSARGALEQLVGLDGYALFASVSLELPLLRRAARGELQSASERSRRTQLDQATVAAQIRTAVATGLGLLETARRRAAVLVPSQRAAALDLEAEQARFEVGRASSFDVLRRQDALAAVQLSLLGAELQRLEADALLAALTGELLARHGGSSGAALP
jgi:outer membrane protein TolC